MTNVVGKLRVDMLAAAVQAELDEIWENGTGEYREADEDVATREAAFVLNGAVLPDFYCWDPATGAITAPPGAHGWSNCDPLLHVVAAAVARTMASRKAPISPPDLCLPAADA